MSVRRLHSIGEIAPDEFYNRSELSTIKLARGVELGHLLAKDPLAPIARKAANAFMYMGQDVLNYLNSSPDVLPSRIDDAAREMTEQAKRDAAIIVALAHDEAEQIREAGYKTVLDRCKKAVSDVLSTITIDITDRAKCKCGVYFLYLEGRLQYVGQSVNVYARIQSHQKKDFDQVRFFPCDKEQLDDFEGLFIRVLQPPLNGVANGRFTGTPKSRLFTAILEITDWVE